MLPVIVPVVDLEAVDKRPRTEKQSVERTSTLSRSKRSTMAKGPLVSMILHHEPGGCLPVFAVHLAGFDELAAQVGNGLVRGLGVDVGYDGVDHVCSRHCPGGVVVVGAKLGIG